MFSVITIVAAFSPTPLRPGVLRAAPVPPITKSKPTMLTGLEGPALVSAGNVILAMNLMPLGPTAYGLGMGGKQMSP